MVSPLRSTGKEKRPVKGSMVDAFITSIAGPETANVRLAGLDSFSQLAPAGREFLEDVLQIRLLSPSVVRHFLDQSSEHLPEFQSSEAIGNSLLQAGLLTEYQLGRLLAGTVHGMVLGNYRVLERLGAGSMAVVFLGEHFLMKRRVAIKVLPVDDDCPAALLERFYGEIHVLADLHHPNIVMAYDAGELLSPAPGMPALTYMVMELVDGGDLEQYLIEHGPAPIALGCDWIRQAACGLQEAHDHHLIHRDIKPSNLLLTRQGQVKVVDFGLARQFCSNLTSQRVLLGSVEFMSPEQSRDPTAVNAQADIYGLGATLFWLLTGELPYPPKPTLAAALRALQQDPPRRLRSLRPDVPEELDELVDQMLARDPAQRPPFPLAVANALNRFASSADVLPWEANAKESHAPSASPAPSVGSSAGRRILLVSGDENLWHSVGHVMDSLNCVCDGVAEGATALELVRQQPYEIVLLDLKLPDMDGYEVCRRLRERPCAINLRIIVLGNHSDEGVFAEALAQGADDSLAQPFEPRQLAVKVKQSLRIKDVLDRYEHLARNLHTTNRQLETSLEARTGDVRQAQDALLFAMSKMAESRDGETAAHLHRLQCFSVLLAERAAAENQAWAGIVDAPFLEQLRRCVPLHDIGKIGLPDQLLSKPGALDPAERALMETHTTIGANILDSLGHEHGESLAFLGTARGIVRHHHERYDGKGYPDRLVGEDIPPAARLTAVADVYDALRRKRFHKPPFPHEEAVRIILEGAGTQFDPVLIQAFAACEQEFDRLFRENQD